MRTMFDGGENQKVRATNWNNALRVGIDLRDSDEFAAAVMSEAVGEAAVRREREWRWIQQQIDADSLASFEALNAHCVSYAFARGRSNRWPTHQPADWACDQYSAAESSRCPSETAL